MEPRPTDSTGQTLVTLLWVCLGGALGTGARFLVSRWTLAAFGPKFPWGTLLVNLAGSFLMGALMFAGASPARLSPMARLALTTGVLGGFTTYSAFSWETLRYLQDAAYGEAALYLAATVAGCLLTCWGGWAVARAVFGA